MKITIRIRQSQNDSRHPTVYLDHKYENGDTPMIQKYGLDILKAFDKALTK